MTGSTPEQLSLFLRTVLRVQITLCALALAATHAFGGGSAMLLGVAVGGAIGLANLAALGILARRIVMAEARTRRFYTMLFGAKLVALLGVTVLVLKLVPLDVAGFAVGFTTLVAAVAAAGFWTTLAPAPTLESEGGSR